MGEKRKQTNIHRMDEVKLEVWKRKAYAAMSFAYFSLRTQLLDIILKITKVKGVGIYHSLRRSVFDARVSQFCIYG